MDKAQLLIFNVQRSLGLLSDAVKTDYRCAFCRFLLLPYVVAEILLRVSSGGSLWDDATTAVPPITITLNVFNIRISCQ
jgi:hypothetical protein